MSIGVLGFVVWSWVLASPHSDMWINIIYLAISWNGLVLISTLNCENLISYTRSAGNLSLYSARSNIQSASETIRETSFNFSAFNLYYNTLFGNAPQHLSNGWLTWFIGFQFFFFLFFILNYFYLYIYIICWKKKEKKRKETVQFKDDGVIWANSHDLWSSWEY